MSSNRSIPFLKNVGRIDSFTVSKARVSSKITGDNLSGVQKLAANFAELRQQPLKDDKLRQTNDNLKDDECNAIPLVLVEGFMGPARPKLYWGPLEDILYENQINSNNNDRVRRRRKCIFVSPGPGNSLHDRAVEVFYQLKGGKEEHSKKFGHARYGREFKGLYPEWSVNKPLHFLGHSMGGLTIWKIQQLLNSNFFPAQHNPHPDMILSLTTLSTPFKGSPALYNLGQQPDTTGLVVPYSFGYWLAMFVQAYDYVDIKWLKKNVFDFQLDHWKYLSTTNSSNEKGFSLLKGSSMFKGRDHGPYDLSVHGMKELNAKSRTFPNTFYRTYVASMTSLDEKTGFHKPKFTMILPLYYLSKLIGSFRFPEDAIDIPIKNDELSQWFENDGLCPVISQYHPERCSPTYCTHHQGLPEVNNNANISQFCRPGVWDVWMIPGTTTHLGVVPVLKLTKKQEQFFMGVKEYLNVLDEMYLKSLEFDI
ncbi:13655_t:CDS:2 [Ambispora gerdemannii]|uniref:13655_t:CDS:1 n=1 Tax=Ambispora gerdemannii TaxID=144530 RepID=A0A9N9AI59_9GLOM|nr:13655_t:CDS:2 [Ambispora gerdemannii]